VTFGLHVHVGVGDGDTAVRVCNRIVEHLPVLLALSANSPFWCGRATGLQSHRADVMAASPSSGPPPRLGGWDDYAALVERLISAGLIATAKDLWWDVRPNSEHGTVEVRVCDMPPDLSAVLGLTALVQCLVVALSRDDGNGNGDGDGARPCLDECGRMIVRQNQWRAARFGLGAELIEARSGRSATAREVAKDLAVRLGGLAKALGCVAELGLVRVMADGPSGAERQLAVFERTGDLTEVVRREMIEPASAAWARNEREWPRADGRAVVNGSWPARGVCWPDGIKRPVRWRLVRSSAR
jgi:carboxylate-amine ligase